MDNFKIIFYLFFILAVCLLPVYLFRKNRKETGIIAGVLVYFFILNKDFILGRLGVYHDTWAMYENIFVLLKQWLDANVPVGWNPYMNAGEPLYLFSNNFLWPVWVVFCWLDRFIQLNNPHTLFNLFWLFSFVNFCSGALLLFYVLYDDFKVSLFCFISLVFSSMFIVNFCAPVGLTITYYFPYILFSVILSIKRKNIYLLAMAAVFLGIAANHYLPHYLILSAGIFVLFLICFHLKLFSKGLTMLRRQAGIIILALILSLLAALPALYLKSELKDYISPTRGGEVLAESRVNWSEQSYQVPVKASLAGYKILLGRFDNNDVFTHHAFYFGILPLLFIIAALLPYHLYQPRRLVILPYQPTRLVRVIFFTMLVILLLGTGKDFFGFRLLIRYVPVFNVFRHTFMLAHFVSFLLICLAGYGLKAIGSLFRQDEYSTSGVVKLTGFILHPRGGIFGYCRRRFFWKLFYLVCIILLLVDLSLFYSRHGKNNLFTEPPHRTAEISYPQQRTFYPGIIYPKNPDLAPLFFKQAVLTDYEGFIFFRNRRLNDMLKLFEPRYAIALGVDVGLVYFTNDVQILPADIPKEQFIREVYQGQGKVFFSEEDIDFGGIRQDSEKDVSREAEIEWTKTDNPNRIELVVDAQDNGFLVRLENFHRSWKAFVDDKPVRIYRANYSFQAIRMPQGRHKVVFQFCSIYPALFYIHILVVFLNWLMFNLILRYRKA